MCSSDLESVMQSASNKSKKAETIGDAISIDYENAAMREDVEVSEKFTREIGLPDRGMQVHSEYTLYAAFFHLKRLLRISEHRDRSFR